MWTISFHDGTLVVKGGDLERLPPGFRMDDRIGHPRGPAWTYPQVVTAARAFNIPYTDDAQIYTRLTGLAPCTAREPRTYQREAVDAWHRAGRRGAVLLPTGSGKTFVAELAMLETERATLVVAPTLDLVGQWHDRLKTAFGRTIGMLGGGQHDVQDITVSTYDSAAIHMGRYGNRFGLVIFDEVHHLGAPGYLSGAAACIAPYRLGLTATWDADAEREDALTEVLGDIVYEKSITELSGNFLADYETIRIAVHLSPEEQAAYEAARGEFKAFVASKRIPLGAPRGWATFLRHAAQSKAGRSAFQAYQESRRIAHGTGQKMATLAQLLADEHGRRTIVFTHDNDTAYRISKRFLVPCISHQTDVKERRTILDAFEAGTLPVIATSRVLNEGVDMPSAEVAIVLSGTGTVREHVQRLGRILRPQAGKQAVLYEVVAADTAEINTSRRRRRHDAYR
ncbi:MAG: DEAD/DEAH box helicase family protein [Myxococcota bacterium]|nr:DEAD/DEAH box helicase family protein [Myxococcota bacterium]MEC9388840.1 DEAD/DEAH box helicase family protein [Myxococcota bacterium]